MAKKKQAKTVKQKMSRKIFSPEWKKVEVTAFTIIGLLILLWGVFSVYQTNVGQAAKELPWPATADLSLDEEIILPSLPDKDGASISITTLLELYGDQKIYTFEAKDLEDGSYRFTITDSFDNIVAKDILQPEESVQVYLNDVDNKPDLKVAFENGKLSVRSRYYIQPAASVIYLFNGTKDASNNIIVKLDDNNREVIWPHLIRLKYGETFTALINASSAQTYPELFLTIDGENKLLSNVINNRADNYTTAGFTYTAPSTAQSVLLDITAKVQGRESKAYYVLAIGNVLYSQRKDTDKSPGVIVTDTADRNKQKVVIDFHNTEQLQPLGLPCEVAGQLDNLFPATSIVDRIYTYDASEAKVWVNGAAAGVSDFTAFDKFKGYFVKLKQLNDDANTKVELECTVKTLEPVVYVPGTQNFQSFDLEQGWNLISLPGIVARPLSEFVDEDYDLYSCTQGYKECNTILDKLDPDTPLDPDKPYWVNMEEEATIRYTLS